ncbi:MAG TPA: type II toxin-antitoxin system Y4mF family antitoxin [Terriglobales bacterium]|nr:type II toxin-antitoxin system Y4mF family antitoxin [Terriglobales bacterium]
MPPRTPNPTPRQIGHLIRTTRQRLGLTQAALALAAGTGLRFIVDLEKGKPTCELGKTLAILGNLGIHVALAPPATAKES